MFHSFNIVYDMLMKIVIDMKVMYICNTCEIINYYICLFFTVLLFYFYSYTEESKIMNPVTVREDSELNREIQKNKNIFI